MVNKPKINKTYLNKSTEDEVRNIAQVVGVSNWETADRDELIRQILDFQKLNAVTKSASTNYTIIEKNTLDSQIVLGSDGSNPEIRTNKKPTKKASLLYSKQEVKESPSENIDVERKGRLLLPVNIDEFAHFWERSYICHPAVLLALVSESHASYEPSAISFFDDIDLEAVYNLHFEILIEFQSEEGFDKNVTWNWICPFIYVKRLIVNNLNAKDSLMRFLNATSRGFTKEIDIGIENFNLIYKSNQDANLTVSENTRKPSEEIVNQIKKLDSYFGGFAISSFIERKCFLESGKISENLSFFGKLAGGALNLKSEFEEDESKSILNYFKNSICDEINSPDNVSYPNKISLYFREMFDIIRSRNDAQLFEYTISQNIGRLTVQEITEIKLQVKNRKWRDAIQQRPSNGRDPFLLFCLVKGNFINLGVPASADRQSFILSLQKYFADGLITQDEMVLMGYFLGMYISYPLLWKPVIEDEFINLKDTDILKLKFSTCMFYKVILKISTSVPLLKILKSNKAVVDDIILTEPLHFKFSNSNLQLLSKNITLIINDPDYMIFEEWSNKSILNKANILMMLLIADLNLDEEISLYRLNEFYFKQNNLELVIEDLKEKIKSNNFSMEKRKWLRLLLIQNV
jgi:hypothetical protein